MAADSDKPEAQLNDGDSSSVASRSTSGGEHLQHGPSSETAGAEKRRVMKRRFSLVGGHRLMRDKLQNRFLLIPSSITVIGLFCGFLALISAIRGDFEYAAKCIGLAIIFDGLDGRVARSLNATSAFGREFDSLSDLVAFGVAPAVLCYCWAFSPVADEFGVLVGFVYVVCGAARLARFNIMTSDEPKSSFVGLPIPGAAFALIALVYAWPNAIQNKFAIACLLFYVLLIAALMVSTLPFFSLKKVKFTRDKQLFYLVAIAFGVALAWKYSRAVILIGASLYAMSGLLKYVLRRAVDPQNEKQHASV